MNKRMSVNVVVVMLLLWLAACAPAEKEATPATKEPIGMPNPASVYCEEQGGKLELRNDENGSYGVCILQDGTECDEWAFFRGECGPNAVQIPDPAGARDAVLDYLRTQNSTVPAVDSVWTETYMTELGLVGSSQLRYTAGGWTADVSYPIVAPQATIYTVVISDTTGNFAWQGTVDASGIVQTLDESTQPGMLQGGAGMANPASVYCEQQGGRLELSNDESGSLGVCIFDDGSQCEEWSFFRGECAPAN